MRGFQVETHQPSRKTTEVRSKKWQICPWRKSEPLYGRFFSFI